MQGKYWKWDRSLSQQAKTILQPIDFEILYNALRDLENWWDRNKITNDEVESLGASFNLFVEISLERTKDLQLLCPTGSNPGKRKLEYLLRCLSYVSEMKAYAGCCPFHKEIRGELILTIKKGVTDRYQTFLLPFLFNLSL